MKRLMSHILLGLILCLAFTGAWYGGEYAIEKVKAERYQSTSVTVWGSMTGSASARLNSVLDEMIKRGDKELEVWIMSPGGSALDTFAMIDQIEYARMYGILVTTRGYGIVASAAVPVLLAGDVREAGAHTIFMLHRGADPDTITNENHLEQYTLVETLYVQAIADHCNLTYDEVLQLCIDHTYFTAEQALEWGMIDRIVN